MSPKKITRPLDIYVRVSQVRGREGDSFISPKDQEERCRQAIRARGLEVGEVLTDLDQSGGKMDRPAFNEALERIREGISGGIVVAKIDRFGRTAARALLAVEEINSLGGVVIAAEGDLDTSTEIGEFVLGIMLQLAQLELRRIRTNWTSAKQHAVDRSLHVSPRVPVGYRRQEAAKGEVGKNGKPKVKVLGPLEPDGQNADTIREAFRMAALGDSYRAIANLFNERGLPIWGGDGVWQPNRIRRVLANRVYLGEAAGGNGHRKANAHEALVDEATFLLAQRHLDRSAPVSTAATTMLAGICRCASCSFSLKAKTHRGERAALYRCMTAQSVHGSCPAPTSISREPLEAYVIEQLLARSDVRLEVVEEADEERAAAVQTALEAEHAYRAWLTNIAMQSALGSDYETRLLALKQSWEETQAAIPPAAAGAAVDSVNLCQLVEDLQTAGEVDSLRELLATQIQAVFVRPAASRIRGLPVADRVHIVWTDEPAVELPRRGTRWTPRRFEWEEMS